MWSCFFVNFYFFTQSYRQRANCNKIVSWLQASSASIMVSLVLLLFIPFLSLSCCMCASPDKMIVLMTSWATQIYMHTYTFDSTCIFFLLRQKNVTGLVRKWWGDIPSVLFFSGAHIFIKKGGNKPRQKKIYSNHPPPHTKTTVYTPVFFSDIALSSFFLRDSWNYDMTLLSLLCYFFTTKKTSISFSSGITD